MNYKNSLCDGCGLRFQEDDDIVVCPECGTPQHRECYKLNNRCVNEHKHISGFDWSGSYTAPAIEAAPATESDKLPCPSCGHLNSADAKICENCSMKLIVFGMNLAEAAKENEELKKAPDEVPDYPPPFALGQGEGFEYNSEAPVADVQPQPDYGQNSQQKVENTKQYLLFRFIGANASRFINAFRKIDSRSGFTFNWAAFFFGPYWFFYRKLYKSGIIFMTLSVIVSIVFSPSLSQSLEGYADALDKGTPLQEIITLYPDVIAFYAVNIALSLLAALVAYPLYKKHAESSIDKIVSAPSPEVGIPLASRLGGTSFMGALAALLITEIISYIISWIMYGM